MTIPYLAGLEKAENLMRNNRGESRRNRIVIRPNRALYRPEQADNFGDDVVGAARGSAGVETPLLSPGERHIAGHERLEAHGRFLRAVKNGALEVRSQEGDTDQARGIAIGVPSG